LLADAEVGNVKLINFNLTKKPSMPRGMYMGMTIKQENNPTPWKVDVWALEDKDFSQNKNFMQNLKSALTPELRDFIIHWKYRLLADKDRISQGASYYLYQAILFEQLRNDNDILDFLNTHGVKI
jgi:hypothetical protein